MKHRLRTLGIAMGVFFVLGLGTLGPVLRDMPRPQASRIALEAGAVGVTAGDSFAWLIPSDSGVVLIDSGMSADALLTELEERGLGPADVRGILLTHAHLDHVGGLASFPDATVYVGAADADLLRGERYSVGALPGLLESIVSRTAPGNPVVEVSDGVTLEIDGLTFEAIHTPGHTAGSTVYRWGEVLFTGDSLAPRGAGVGPLPALFADDIDENIRSLGKLADIPFRHIADGHVGTSLDAQEKLRTYLGDP